MNKNFQFEIATKNPVKTINFYKCIFGWEILRWDNFKNCWLIKTGVDGARILTGAIKFNFGKKKEFEKNSYVATISVSSVDEFLKKVYEVGGKVVVSKMEIPGVGSIAYCLDPEENVFGIIQNQPAE